MVQNNNNSIKVTTMASRKRSADDALNNSSPSTSSDNLDMSEFAEFAEEVHQVSGSTDARSNNCAYDAALNVFWDYCGKSKALSPAVVKQMSPGELDDLMRSFYIDARKQDGNPFSNHSLMTLRYGLQKFFQQRCNVDIVRDDTFKTSNLVFNAIMANHVKTSSPVVKNSHIIFDEDMDKIRSSYLTDCSSPKGLQNTVFLNIMLHFHYSTYGHWNLRDMKKSHFTIKMDAATNRRYVCFTNKAKLQQHLSPDNAGEFDDMDTDIHNNQVRMYEAPHNPDSCPVATFEEYMSKLDPMCDSFWQRPKKYRPRDRYCQYWYDGVAVGVNSLGYKMRDISTEAGCSLVYSNHCLKVTSRACRLKMTMTGAECSCSGQHFFPNHGNRDKSGGGHHGYNALVQDGRPNDDDDPIHEDIDLQNFVKLEPGDQNMLEDDEPVCISVQSEEGESLPDVNYYLTLPNLCGNEAHGGMHHLPPATTQASSSIAVQIENQSQTHPVRISRANAISPPGHHAPDLQVRRNINSTSNHDEEPWRVERTWLDGNSQRKWLLSQDSESDRRLCLASENSSKQTLDEHMPQNQSSRAHMNRNASSNSPDIQQGLRSRSLNPGSAAGNVIDQHHHNSNRSPGAKRVAQNVPSSTGSSSSTPTMIAADDEVLQLQKDVLRMQRENLSLERRKLELEIAKLETEVMRTRGES